MKMKMSMETNKKNASSSPLKASSSSGERSSAGEGTPMEIDGPIAPPAIKSADTIGNDNAQYQRHPQSSSHSVLSVSESATGPGGCGSASFLGATSSSGRSSNRGRDIGINNHLRGVTGIHAGAETVVATAPTSLSTLPSMATQDVKQAESLLAKEMYKLSTEERSRVLDEIHGVAEEIDETDEFITDCLKKMEEEVLKIRKRSAYEKALFVKPSAVKDPTFRLMFLRAEYYDPKKAAKRMVSYFHHKLRLFGFDSLIRPITLDDLDEHDKHALNAGTMQFLPIKDKSGRTIVCNFHKFHDFQSSINQVRRKSIVFEHSAGDILPYHSTHLCLKDKAS